MKWSKEKSPCVRLWREYREQVYQAREYPLDTHQERETSRAFYAGMMAAFSLMVKVSEYDEPEETGAARLENLRRDIAQAATETLTPS